MISTTRLDELKALHNNYIASTFLFASKLLDQRRRISDAQAEAIHGLLRDAAVNTIEQAGKDPTVMAQQAVQKISKSIANQNAHSNELMKETAAAYAEVMRLAIAYGNDTFTALQNAGRSVSQLDTPTPSMANPWVDGFVPAFEQAVELMNSGIRPTLHLARSTAGASTGNGKGKASSTGGRAAQ